MISVEQSMPVIIMTAPIMPVFFFMIAVSASAAVMVTI
jgi:hypothetical protein